MTTVSSMDVASQAVWKWSVFGGDVMTVVLPYEVSWLRRTLTSLLLGSVWEKVA